MRKSISALLICICISCAEKAKKEENQTTSEVPKEKVTFMTLDPGHFHAALVQKTMYPQVDSTSYVYAPDGPEVQDFLSKIDGYNTRPDSPTSWTVKKQLGDDYLNAMLAEKPGNVMIVAGKNSKKVDYILEAVKSGLNVYADKPLVINEEGFEKLKEAFKIADEKGLMIYDIMTERFESTTGMQKLFSTLPSVFGELVDGSVDEPAISKESVHHFSKIVSGKPLVRPSWFFDIVEEGEGIVDVTTHLVDLVQWEAFPDQIIDSSDVEMLKARRWPTTLTKAEFTKVTKQEEYPDYLKKDLDGDKLNVYCNGEMIYKINGKHAKVSVIWNYEAPAGAADTHYSIMRGTKSNLIIKQGEEEGYKPILYVEANDDTGFEAELNNALEQQVAQHYPGTTVERISKKMWKVNIPDSFKVGHEAHFGQVTQNYLKYLDKGELPAWEVPNMITKYYTTIEAYKMARSK
ncbi:putative oxidoreductase C-terminal domain-containing protein [uncultured Kriegella sp.]|uniref:putative oxidoreductase C-terminal domain-containing protein n=1 Tax=uncultured Kriegella sp. TaxID=1798910 RepID=UPI0030DD4504|tara:strand:+ start:20633 stop:22018 length:1386 start_codon:yes stop_codon:yes gene_type:complete